MLPFQQKKKKKSNFKDQFSYLYLEWYITIFPWVYSLEYIETPLNNYSNF